MSSNWVGADKNMYTIYPKVPRQTIRNVRSELNKDFKEYIASLPEEQQKKV